jgi:hypothetical protein
MIGMVECDCACTRGSVLFGCMHPCGAGELRACMCAQAGEGATQHHCRIVVCLKLMLVGRREGNMWDAWP